MKLYQQQASFQVTDMVKAMLDVSAIRIKTMPEIRGGFDQWIQCALTSFSFGRQAGHTTGIIDYLKSNPNAYYFVHSHDFANDIIRRHPALTARVWSAETYNVKFEGKQNIEIIIDGAVGYDSGQRFLENIARHVHRISAVCKVGS